jgi:hypothetical protein
LNCLGDGFFGGGNRSKGKRDLGCHIYCIYLAYTDGKSNTEPYCQLRGDANVRDALAVLSLPIAYVTNGSPNRWRCALFTDVPQAEPAHSPELVTAEGRRVEAVTEGTGTPAVVFESGSNGSSSWEPIESQIAQKTMSLRYQRAGLGRSDPEPNPRNAAQVAKELHALLSAKSVRPPYVLVGHSAGGLYVRVLRTCTQRRSPAWCS